MQPSWIEVWDDNGANLWIMEPEDQSGYIDPAELGLPSDVCEGFREWALESDKLSRRFLELGDDYPANDQVPGSMEADVAAFDRMGRALAERLKVFYGDAVRISYMPRAGRRQEVERSAG